MKATVTAVASASNKRKRAPFRDVKPSVGNIRKDGNEDEESVPKKPVILNSSSLDDANMGSSTRQTRSKRGATAKKVKYVETTEDEEETSADDDDDESSVSRKVTESKTSKGKGAPAVNISKKKGRKLVPNKDDSTDAESARISIIRNSSATIQHSSPLGSSDWRSSFAIDY